MENKMNRALHHEAMAFIKNLVLCNNGVARDIKENALNILLKEASQVLRLRGGVTISHTDAVEIGAWLNQDKKIQAIKYLRGITHLDLKEAKEITDNWSFPGYNS